MKKIGIFGGTFDPVHVEHIRLVNHLVENEGFDQIIVMPTFIPPHKVVNEITAPTHRFNMLKECFTSNKVIVSDYEIKKEGKSYSFETVEHFKSIYKEDDLYFIVGLDMLVDFKRWKNPERILESAKLLTAIRKEEQVDERVIEDIIAKEKEYFKKTFNKSFFVISFLGENVSSTKIRVYNKLGLSLQGLTDSKVIEYIKENKLYLPDKYYLEVQKYLPEKGFITRRTL